MRSNGEAFSYWRSGPKLALPSWLATIEQVPAVISVTVAPETVFRSAAGLENSTLAERRSVNFVIGLPAASSAFA
jgi:hypothetical protein